MNARDESGVWVKVADADAPSNPNEPVPLTVAAINDAPGVWDQAHILVPALCLDLDGTVRYSKSGSGYVTGPDDIAVYPDVERIIHDYQAHGFIVCGVTNQGGVAFGHKTVRQNYREIEETRGYFDGSFDFVVCACCHPGGSKPPFNVRTLLRKPAIGMLAVLEFWAFDCGYVIDWDNSLFVGDRPEDKQCAESANIAFAWAHDFFGRSAPA